MRLGRRQGGGPLLEPVTMRLLLALVLVAPLLVAVPAASQDFDTDVPSAVVVEASATVLTDFRFRGVSQSDREPAAQASVTVRHESGLAVGAFVSSQQGRDIGDPLFGTGDVRAELFASYAAPLSSGLRGEVGATAYLFPDRLAGRNTNFVEPYAALSYDLGPAEARVAAAYAPAGQSALGRDDSLYLSADLTVGVPTTPFTVAAHLGHTDGSLARRGGLADGDRLDWSVGVEGVQGPLVGGVRYVDTDVTGRGRLADRLGADATVVLFVGVRF